MLGYAMAGFSDERPLWDGMKKGPFDEGRDLKLK